MNNKVRLLATLIAIAIFITSLFVVAGFLQSNYYQQQNTLPDATPLQYVQLQARIYETSSYWTRHWRIDLPVYNSNIAYEVMNLGNREATNVNMTVYSDNYPWKTIMIPLIQPYQRVTDQISELIIDYDQTKTLKIEATCDSSSDTQTYTVNAKLPRAESDFNENQNIYKLYITPKDPTVQSLVSSITTNPLIPNWMEIRDWVSNHITYQYDSVVHGETEYWQLPRETLMVRDEPGKFVVVGQELRTGDCEDYAILAVSLLRADGWSPNDVYVVTGRTTENGQTVGHAFVKINILGLWYFWEPQDKIWLTWLLSDFSLTQYAIDGTFNDQYVEILPMT